MSPIIIDSKDVKINTQNITMDKSWDEKAIKAERDMLFRLNQKNRMVKK
jgi:hypothetical protein